MHFLWFAVVGSIVCSASAEVLNRSNTYSLIYDAPIAREVIAKYPDEGTVPYSMVMDLSTDIATDIIQTYSVTKTLTTRTESEVKQQERQLEMDRRCNESIMGGGRCNIDHYRPGEVIIQISLQFEEQSDQGVGIKVDVSLSAQSPELARDVLVRLIPIISKQINCFQGMSWSIRERPTPSFLQESWDDDHNMVTFQDSTDARKASLESIILERADINSRMRISSSKLHEVGERALEVWTYRTPEVRGDVRALFVDGILQSTTHLAGHAHAEALVHPAMISFESSIAQNSAVTGPKQVVILSLEPAAILREVMKHKSVQSVVLLGVDENALQLSQRYLTSQSDCSFLERETVECLAQPEVKFEADVDRWFAAEISRLGDDGDSSLDIHVFLVDIPISNDEWLDHALQVKIRKVLANEDSVLALSYGSSPIISDNYGQDNSRNARDQFLQKSGRSEAVGGLDYSFIYVYDEPLAAPLGSSFFILFSGDSDTLVNFLSTNGATVEIDIVSRLHPMGGPPTRVYDGATHVNYQRPSRAWQDWYCSTPSGKSRYICKEFLTEWYDPKMHLSKTEVRSDPVKGRSLHTVNAVAEGTFVLPDDAAFQLRIDSRQWHALNEFVKMFPSAVMYREIRDFFVTYGFECEVMGLTGWSVSIANNSTFTNHACTKADETVRYVEELHFSGNEYARFSPIEARYRELAGTLAKASRDIAAGEELQIDYSSFRSDEDVEFEELLRKICTSGVGLVPVDDENKNGDKLDEL